MLYVLRIRVICVVMCVIRYTCQGYVLYVLCYTCYTYYISHAHVVVSEVRCQMTADRKNRVTSKLFLLASGTDH